MFSKLHFDPEELNMEAVEAKLGDLDIWQGLHKVGNEQIISKAGRYLFPKFWISLKGLEKDLQYFIGLEFSLLNDKRYKYRDSGWYEVSRDLPQNSKQFYLHPKCPKFGKDLTHQPLCFNQLRCSNVEGNSNIVLSTMHKYIIKLHIIQTSNIDHLTTAPRKVIIFPETQFMAVTTYKNKKISVLKINLNSRATSIRKRLAMESIDKSECQLTLNPPHESTTDSTDAIESKSSVIDLHPSIPLLNDSHLTEEFRKEFMTYFQIWNLVKINATFENNSTGSNINNKTETL